MKKSVLERCAWSTMSNSPLMLEYHDKEWGVPVHTDRTLFEFLTLEGAQAGLSWETVLNKRENYRQAFRQFEPVKIARFNATDMRRLLANPGIIRNRLKIESTSSNAREFLNIRKECGSFDGYAWSFVGGKPIKHAFKSLQDIPSSTSESDALSKDLKKRGFRFVGSTICYALMQAVGMVNDHTVNCFRYDQLSGRSGTLRPPIA